MDGTAEIGCGNGGIDADQEIAFCFVEACSVAVSCVAATDDVTGAIETR